VGQREDVTLSGDATAEAVDAGGSVGHWWMILHICIQGWGDEAGTEGGKPTINGLGIMCPNRHWFWYEGSNGAQGSYEGPLWVTARDGS